MSASLGTLTLDLIARLGGFTGPLDQARQQARTAMGEIQKSTQGATESIKKMGEEVKKVGEIVGLGLGVAEIVKTADEYQNLLNKLKLVTNGQEQLYQAYKDVFQIAQSTRSDMESIATVYQRFAQNSDVLALNQKKVAEITRVVAQGVAVSGASAAVAEQGITQFGQALALGKLSGQDLHSVMSELPGVMQILEVGLGKTQGELKAMADAGELTSEVLVKGLSAGAKYAQEQVDKTAITISQSFTLMKNAAMNFLGEQTNGPAHELSNTLKILADNFDTIATAGEIFAAGKIARYLATVTVETGKNAQATIQKSIADQTALAAEVGVTQATLRRAEAEKVATLAQLDSARASVASFNSQIERYGIFIADSKEYQAALKAETAAVGRAATAVMAEKEANIAASEAKRIAAASSGALSTASGGLLGLLGGPIGLIGLAASAAVGFWMMGDNAEKSKPKIDDLGKTLDEVKNKLSELSDAQRENISLTIDDKVNDQKESLTALAHEYIKASNAAAFYFGTHDQNGQRDSINELQKQLIAGAINVDQFNAKLQKMALPEDIKKSLTVAASAWDGVNAELEKSLSLSGNVKQVNSDIASQDQASRDALAAKLKMQQNDAELVDKIHQEWLKAKTTGKDISEVERVKLDLMLDQTKTHKQYSEEMKAALLAQAAAVDAQKDADESKKKRLEAITQTIQKQAEAIQKEKEAYLALNETFKDPLQKLDDDYKRNVELVNRAASGIFVAAPGYSENLSSANVSTVGGHQALSPSTLQLASMINLSKIESDYANLPKGIMTALMEQESHGNPNAVNPYSGARGAFQFMPATAREYDIDPMDPFQAAPAAAEKLSGLIKRFKGDVNKALQAYNWGEGNLDQYLAGNKSMPKETRDYAPKVLSKMGAADPSSLYTLSDALKQTVSKDNRDFNMKLIADDITLKEEAKNKSVDLAKAEAVEKKAILAARHDAGYDLFKLSLDQELAALTDNAKSEKEIIDERYNFERRKIQDTEALNIDQIIHKQMMLDALEAKHKQDQDSADYRRGGFGRQQALQLQQYTDDAKHNDQKYGMSSVQGQMFDTEYQIRKGFNSQINGLNEQRNDPSTNEDTKKQIDEKIKLLQDASDKEVEIAKNTDTYKRSLLQEQLGYTSHFFGDLSTLTQSKNKELAAIGKAAAIAQATIDGILAVQKTMAATPSPWNIALATAQGVVAAENVAKIAGIGFKTGGYTGDGDVNAVAGPVHGKEFVINAENTAKYRPILEQMNAGSYDPRKVVSALAQQANTSNRIASVTASPTIADSQSSQPNLSGLAVHSHFWGTKEMMEDYIKSSDSDKHFITKIERNSSSISRVLS